MAATSKNVYYPTSSDNIAPLETHFANLANSADNIGIVSGTTAFTGPSATGGTVTVNVTFATALSAAPKVIASVRGGASSYVANVSGTPTTTGFSVTVYKLNNATAESLNLDWFASTYA